MKLSRWFENDKVQNTVPESGLTIEENQNEKRFTVCINTIIFAVANLYSLTIRDFTLVMTLKT